MQRENLQSEGRGALLRVPRGFLAQLHHDGILRGGQVLGFRGNRVRSGDRGDVLVGVEGLSHFPHTFLTSLHQLVHLRHDGGVLLILGVPALEVLTPGRSLDRLRGGFRLLLLREDLFIRQLRLDVLEVKRHLRKLDVGGLGEDTDKLATRQ